MSGRINALKTFQIITAGDASQATVTSAVTNILYMNTVAVQMNITGAPVGAFAIQVSCDYSQDAEGNVTNAGNWVTVVTQSNPLFWINGNNQTLAITGPTNIVVTLLSMPTPWMRVVYTKTSGTGAINAFITAKSS